MTACYELDCVDCPFETIVVGSFADAIGEADGHRTASAVAPAGHFVNVRLQARLST